MMKNTKRRPGTALLKETGLFQKREMQKRNTIRGLMILPFFFITTLAAFGQNMFVNGSMNGKPTISCDGNTNGTVPDGWAITSSSPDVNSPSKAPIGGCTKWLTKPVPSPNGESFESIISFGGQNGSSEGFAQTISGLTAGRQYIFSYYWANTPTSYNNAALPAITVSGFESNVKLNPTTSSTPWKWNEHTVVLTARDSIATFDFRAVSSNQDIAYTSFDGISLTPCNAGGKAPVPLKNKMVIREETANLLRLQGDAAPFGSQPIWHRGTPGTINNMVNNPISVSPGSYYLTFYDVTNRCFSPTSGEIRITKKK
jgi:hypothetical protein